MKTINREEVERVKKAFGTSIFRSVEGLSVDTGLSDVKCMTAAEVLGEVFTVEHKGARRTICQYIPPADDELILVAEEPEQRRKRKI